MKVIKKNISGKKKDKIDVKIVENEKVEKLKNKVEMEEYEKEEKKYLIMKESESRV
jgi:uncharacterized ferredoxin-like protein